MKLQCKNSPAMRYKFLERNGCLIAIHDAFSATQTTFSHINMLESGRVLAYCVAAFTHMNILKSGRVIAYCVAAFTHISMLESGRVLAFCVAAFTHMNMLESGNMRCNSSYLTMF